MKMSNQLKKTIGYVLLATPILFFLTLSVADKGLSDTALGMLVIGIFLGIMLSGFYLIDSSKRDD